MENGFVLPVFQVDISDLHEPLKFPQTGEEYLRNVIIERKGCPRTVTAEINDKKLNLKQNIFATVFPEKPPAPSSLLPSEEWQTIQLANFSTARNKVSNLYESKDIWTHPVKLPHTVHDTSPHLWRAFFKSINPHLRLVLTMNQMHLEFALDVLIDELDTIEPGSGLNREYGLWLYAILTALKLPLVPNTCSSLRNLARKCSIIRSQLSETDENAVKNAPPLNLFICLVARYFNQVDLSD